MTTIDTPKASTAFNGTAQTHGFEFRINGAHTPYLELHMQPGPFPSASRSIPASWGSCSTC